LFDFLTNLSAGGFSLFGYIIPFLIILTIVVFFHELGHYLVAKWNGVDIDAFAIGFGPELIGFNDRANTRWKLCAIPLGGYVKFAGDANAASVPDHERLQSMSEQEKAGSFEHKSVAQRAAVVLAGPVANFILAIIIFAGSFYFVGRYVSDPVITEIMEDSAAQEAGLLAGDVVLKIDGTEIRNFSQIPRIVGPKHGFALEFVVEREGVEKQIMVTPKLTEQTDQFGNVNQNGVVGIISSTTEANLRKQEYGMVEAVWAGVGETGYIIKRTFQYVGGLITGRESAEQLSGPIGIAKISGEIATLGPAALISLAAILSVSIGLLNLFPVPMLDGGHLVFYAYEALVGKPVNEKVQEMAYRFGFILLIGLMLFATHNDIVNRLGLFG
jgi:regulator of sigma E protease